MPPPAEAFFGTATGDHRLGGDQQARNRRRGVFWIAVRTTLVGSMMPFLSMSTYSPDCASKP